MNASMVPMRIMDKCRWTIMKPYVLGLYEKATPKDITWGERLSAAHDAGFDFLEISVDETDDRLERLSWSFQQRNELRSLAQDKCIPIQSMCLSGLRRFPFGHPNCDIRKQCLNILDAACKFACDMGIRLIQIPGYDVYYEQSSIETRTFFDKSVRDAVSIASSYGVVLAFETMETPFMDTVEKAMCVINQQANAYLGIYPDIGNLTNASFLYGNTVADDIFIGKGHIFAAHCKETIAGKYREVDFGSGTTDYSGSLTALAECNVRRYVGEFWYTGSPEWRKDLQKAYAYLSAKLDRAWGLCH